MSTNASLTMAILPQATSEMFDQDSDDDHSKTEKTCRRSSSIEFIPPPPPPPPEFSDFPTPKINNCKASTKRQRKLLRMLDNECSPVNSPSLPESKRMEKLPSAPAVFTRTRRRPTPISCPLDDPIPSRESEREECSVFDLSEPPSLPLRRNGLCPSNMPTSVLVQMVMGR